MLIGYIGGTRSPKTVGDRFKQKPCWGWRSTDLRNTIRFESVRKLKLEFGNDELRNRNLSFLQLVMGMDEIDSFWVYLDFTTRTLQAFGN